MSRALHRFRQRRWLVATGLVAAYLVVWGVDSWMGGDKLSVAATEQAWAAKGYRDVSCVTISNSDKQFRTDTADDYDYQCSFKTDANRRDYVLLGVNGRSITTISP